MKSVVRNGACIAAVLLGLLAVSIGRTDDASLQSDLDTILAEEGLTGIAWMLLDGSGETRSAANGFRDNEARIEFTTDTRFHVGSVSKVFLATGILRLASTGVIELDDPVSRYLPELPLNNPWIARSPVTVRHLLDHTSGLQDALLWQLFSERVVPDTPLIEAFPDPDSLLHIRVRPGTRFSYSNMGYALLGLVIEAATGERYESYLDSKLLAPLGMRDSTFEFTTQAGANADPTLAWGHIDDGSRYAASAVFLRPAAQFTTTIGDMARFAEFLMGEGSVGGQAFIRADLMRSRGRPAGTEAANAGLEAGYSFGLGRRDRQGVVGYCHSGNIVGFFAMLCIYPEERKAFAYSVNTDSETADYGRIEGAMVAALDVAKASPPATETPQADVADWYGRYVLSPNRFTTFEYLDNLFGSIRLSGDVDGIAVAYMQRSPRQLRPVGGHLYAVNDRTTTSHVLMRSSEGDYLVSDGFVTYKKIPSSYLYAHWSSVALGLVGLAWILVAGIVSLLRHRRGMIYRPEAPGFASILLLALPVPYFMNQSFMALGDVTTASVLLALVTLTFPIGMLLTIRRVWKTENRSWSVWTTGLSSAFVMQWCAVLAMAGLLPLRIWT